MKGLLLKDWYTLKKPEFYITILIILITVTTALFVGGETLNSTAEMILLIFPVATSVIPISLYIAEKQEKWNVYSMTFPVSRKTYVSEKYVFGLILTFIFLFLSAIMLLIQMKSLDNGSADFMKVYLFRVTEIFILSLFTMSLTFPIAFRFDSVFVFICMICGAAGGLCAGTMDYNVKSAHSDLISIVLLTVSIVLYVLSWLISVHIYKKKEL